MKSICLIGAGNIGSRHLQGLKRVRFPLSINVVDPSPESLNIARERYDQILTGVKHRISYSQNIKETPKSVDLAIIATSSNIRREVLDDLFSNSSVKYLILEKILFQKKKDYSDIEKLLKDKGCKTWVNFSMRTMPSYANLKEKINGPVQMVVSGSQYGLITNVVHFVDYIAFLTECYDFTLNTNILDSKFIESKRPGFLELNGTLNAYFKDGSVGTFTCYDNSYAPYLIEILSSNYRYISKENEGRSWISSSLEKWGWQEVRSEIPYQSEMTNKLVEEILEKGTCQLSPYTNASNIHLQLLEPIREFISRSKKYDFYPFT